MVTPWQAAFVGFSNWRGLPLEQALYPGAYRLEIDRDAPKERRGWEAMAWNAANLAVYEKFYDELPDTVRVQADLEADSIAWESLYSASRKTIAYVFLIRPRCFPV